MKLRAQCEKIACEAVKRDAFSDRKRLDFAAATCSKNDSRTCAEQNHLREKIEKLAKPKNRLQPGSDAQQIASL
jgi:hypothetical protein